jgi:hypothetical protein
MTSDLNELRETLQAPSDFVPGSLDLDTIMREGGRLRRRRRAVVGAGVGLSALIVIAGVSGLSGRIDASHSVVPADPSPTAQTAPTTPALVKPVGALGEVISTGLPAEKGGVWVIYGKKMNDKFIPSLQFELVLGEVGRSGRVEPASESSAVEGSGFEGGFHGVEHSYGLVGGVTQPAFGYFSGPVPARIVGLVKGREVVARQAVWSVDSRVTVYWFDSSQVSGTTRLTGVRAYDEAGVLLPHGSAKVYYE